MSTVIRVEKTSNYVVMSNTHLRETELSLKAKGLLSMMLSLPPNWDYSIGGLVAICKESQTAIRSTLKELEQFKYLKRNRMKDEKGLFIYEYVIYEHPYDDERHNENLHTDEQYIEKRHTGKQHKDSEHTENVRQLSKEKLNKEKLNKEKINKDKSNTKYDEILENIFNKDLKQLYEDYIEMRHAINAPLTQRGLKMLIDRVDRLSGFNVEEQKQLLETAIINNWKNVYNPNEKENKEDETYKKLKSIYFSE